jgi:hypothetical protein
MNKLTKLIQPVSRLICAVSGFVLLGVGAADIQSDHVQKGGALVGAAVPLVGFVIGKKNLNKENEEGTTDGN